MYTTQASDTNRETRYILEFEIPKTASGRVSADPHDLLPADKCSRFPRQLQRSTFGMLTRSHTGCWTCKRRRRRCDNGRPACQNCRERRVDCEGYEIRLKWGAGIASRGRFTGADKPIQDSVPPRQKGRQRDLGRKEKEKENRARDPGQYIETMMRFRVNLSTDGSQLETRRTEAEDAIFDECEHLGEMI